MQITKHPVPQIFHNPVPQSSSNQYRKRPTTQYIKSSTAQYIKSPTAQYRYHTATSTANDPLYYPVHQNNPQHSTAVIYNPVEREKYLKQKWLLAF